MGKLMVGYVVIAFPIVVVLFGLFALGVITFRKPPPAETPAKPVNLRPPPRPKKPEPELTEKEKRRAARRARRGL